MSNSSLVEYTKISPNKNSPRNHAIDTITIHCVVGQLTAEGICDCFISPSREASCNYAIGRDGKIALCVDEKDRSWCSSSASNDNRAITIECASDTKPPYAINSYVYNSLIDLCTDICKRNGIKELKWKADKKLIGKVDQQNMTVHRWFANKDCPGDYIYNRLGEIAQRVNDRLKNVNNMPNISTGENVYILNKKPPFRVKISIKDLNIRLGAGTNFKKTGSHIPVGVYTIIEVKAGEGSKLGWGKLKSGAGWVSLDFVDVIS